MKIVEESFNVDAANIAIIIARFNNNITRYLLDGAIDTLKRVGNIQDQNITVIWVPGSYELPLAAKALSMKNNHNNLNNNVLNYTQYDALIALGVIIKGVTSHFDFISQSCIKELSRISVQYKLPIGLGVLTTDNIEQALERSGIKNVNKGSEAALSVLEMINVLRTIDK